MVMAKKKNYQNAALWSKDFEELDFKIDGYTPVFTSDLTAIISKDYSKFFSKICKKPYTKKELKQMILSEYQNYIDVWNPVAVN